jgi:hypothetical protein
VARGHLDLAALFLGSAQERRDLLLHHDFADERGRRDPVDIHRQRVAVVHAQGRSVDDEVVALRVLRADFGADIRVMLIDPGGQSLRSLQVGVEQAPAICTVGVTSSTSLVVMTLCGMVIRAPRILVSLNRYLKNSGYCSALTPIGTTTASMPFFSNHGL